MKVLTYDFDLAIYSLAAIKRAAYDLSGKFDTRISLLPENWARIELLIPETSSFAPADLLSEFSRSILDHQVRLEAQEDYRVIREMIVAQAFEPCENIGEVMKTVEP